MKSNIRIAVWVFACLCSLTFPCLVSAQNLIVDGQGTSTISWTVPTEYANGDPLPATEIAGYVIYYGDVSCLGVEPRPDEIGNSACYQGRVDVSDGAATSAPATLTLGADTTVYFRMATLATNGFYSVYGNEDSVEFVLQVSDNRPPGAPVVISIDVAILCNTNNPDITCTFDVQ